MDIKALFGLTGKNVVITGAGSGMGQAAARLLVELGANVYTVDRRALTDLEVTKEIQADLSSPEGLDAAIAQFPETIEALYICHGIANTPGRTNAKLVQLINFYSFKYLTEKVIDRIADNGSVTFISSYGGKDWRRSFKGCEQIIACKSWDEAVQWYDTHPEYTDGGYVFSKECQFAYVMSKCHSPEFIDRKIRLNAIGPGMTKTGLTNDFNRSINGDAAQGQAILEKSALEFWNGRWATPEEMGYPLVAIGSKLFSYMSGQTIYLDYGATSRWELEELKHALNA